MTALAATALRWAAIEALSPTGAAVFPTIAGNHFYDSRMTIIDDLQGDERAAPHVGVFTDKLNQQSRGNAAAMDSQTGTIDLVFEIEVAVLDRTDGQGGVGTLSMDVLPALELDMLGSQILQVLENGQTGALFRRVCKQIGSQVSETTVVPDIGLRLARTTLTLGCEMDGDCWAVNGLPEPLAMVVNGLPPASPFVPLANSIIARLTATTAADSGVPLTEIQGEVTIGDPDQPIEFGVKS